MDELVFFKCFNVEISQKRLVYSEVNGLNTEVVWIQGIIVDILSSNSNEESSVYVLTLDDGTDLIKVQISPSAIGIDMPELRCYIHDTHMYKNIVTGDYLSVQGHLALSPTNESQIHDSSTIAVDYIVADTFSVNLEPNMETLWLLEVIHNRQSKKSDCKI